MSVVIGTVFETQCEVEIDEREVGRGRKRVAVALKLLCSFEDCMKNRFFSDRGNSTTTYTLLETGTKLSQAHLPTRQSKQGGVFFENLLGLTGVFHDVRLRDKLGIFACIPALV